MRNELFSTPKIDYLSNLLLPICVKSLWELKPKQINANVSRNDLGKIFVRTTSWKHFLLILKSMPAWSQFVSSIRFASSHVGTTLWEQTKRDHSNRFKRLSNLVVDKSPVFPWIWLYLCSNKNNRDSFVIQPTMHGIITATISRFLPINLR